MTEQQAPAVDPLVQVTMTLAQAEAIRKHLAGDLYELGALNPWERDLLSALEAVLPPTSDEGDPQ